MHHPISIFAAAAAIVSVASPALAQVAHSASVKIYQTDFATAQSRGALEHRIQRAVEEVCGVNAMAEHESWKQIKQCQFDVRREFDRQISAAEKSLGLQLSAR